MSGYKKYLVPIPLGFLTGLLTLFVVPSVFELWLWLALIFSMALLAKRNFEYDRLFRRSFLFAVVTGICITLTHLIFIDKYLAGHAAEMEWMNKLDVLNSTRLSLLVIAPVYWVALGFLTGIIASVFP